jgi:hypothetical protein
MESDVTQTLSELERKLKELERELENVGRGGETDAEPAQAGWSTTPAAPPAPPPGAPAPPAGVTPFTAQWHGSGPPQGAAPPPPPPPPPAYNGAPPAVPVPPPTATVFGQQATPAPPPYVAAAPPPPPPPPAAGLHHQLDELLAFRERLVRSTNELVDELSRVLADLGVDVGPAAAPAPPPPPGPDETLFAGPVTIEAGHFGDLATLAAFEQAIARTHGVAEVAVRALDAGRATIELTLAEPVPLGLALRQTSPVPFSLTVAGERLVHLTIVPAGPPG